MAVGPSQLAVTRTRILLISAAAMLAFAAAGVSIARDDDWKVPPTAKSMKNPIAPSPDGIATAHAIFMDKCANCHGDKGVGDGPEAGMYDPAPSNLADAKMMNSMTDGEIFYKITEGRKPMPSFKKDLDDQQRWLLVNFVRTLAPKPSGGNGHSKPGN